MSEVSILLAIAKAVQTANIDDPVASGSQFRVQTILGNEASLHLAKAALRGLSAAGYVVIPTRELQGAGRSSDILEQHRFFQELRRHTSAHRP